MVSTGDKIVCSIPASVIRAYNEIRDSGIMRTHNFAHND